MNVNRLFALDDCTDEVLDHRGVPHVWHSREGVARIRP